MAVTEHDRAEWARNLADVLNHATQNHEQIKTPFNLGTLFAESASNLTNPELKAAILEAAALMKPGIIDLRFLSNKEVFGNWLKVIFDYGSLYNELEEVLRRYADRPEDHATDIFGPTGGNCTEKAWDEYRISQGILDKTALEVMEEYYRSKGT